jgi:hypothetical protein
LGFLVWKQTIWQPWFGLALERNHSDHFLCNVFFVCERIACHCLNCKGLSWTTQSEWPDEIVTK